jgi:hypothetical protein
MARPLCGVERLRSPKLENFLPYDTVTADLLARTARPEAARRPSQGPSRSNRTPRVRVYEACIGVPHFLATQYLRTNSVKPQFPNGIVSSVSFVSTTNTARSLAGFVSLALALTPWRSPGSSEKLCPAL